MESAERYSEIVVLGGGFAGVYATKAASKALAKRSSDATVTIVSDDNHMVFQPMLPEVAGSALSPRHVVNPIRNLCKDASVFRGEAIDLDAEKKVLTLSVGSFAGTIRLRFDQLVVCLGSKINVSMIPGMQEHSFRIQNVGDAMLLRATVINRFEEANLTDDPEQKKRLLSFVFVGGGYSGVETAGQILDLSKAICHYYKNIDFDDCSFTLVHSGKSLMPTTHESLGEYTRKQLEKRGLTVKLSRRVSAVTSNRVFLNDDTTIEANTVLCAVGNAPHPLLDLIHERTGAPLERGRIATRRDGSVDGVPWLWGAGDCSSFPHPKEGNCPPTAQFAQRQGELVGRNIVRQLFNSDTKELTFTGLGELAAIGHRTAVAEIKGFRFSGFFAWWLWRTVYLAKLPRFERKIRVLFDWTLELFFPRDVTLLNPRYSTDVSETYLTDGDTLFNSGDPAFSFYIVKSGTIEFRENGTTVKRAREGQHFGERALMDDGYFRFDAIAVEPTTLININKDLFQRLFQSANVFAENLRRSASSFISNAELQRLIQRLPAHTLDQKVADLMTSDLVTFTCDEKVSDAIEKLKHHPRNYIPIVKDGKVEGVVRKESLYLRLQAADTSMDEPVSSLPKEHLPFVQVTDSVKEAITQMARNGSTKALALDQSERLKGVIALTDIFTRSKNAVSV